jgi:hypothetical protein
MPETARTGFREFLPCASLAIIDPDQRNTLRRYPR